jgi:hypothetical protein
MAHLDPESVKPGEQKVISGQVKQSAMECVFISWRASLLA